MLSKVIKAYGHFRAGVYFLESLPLLGITSLVKNKDRYRLTSADVDYLRESVDKLFKFDAECIEKKVYPVSVLAPNRPFVHFNTLRKVYADALKVVYRKLKRKTDSFSKEALRLVEDMPEYYQRNFHFQTDGYLSDSSAEMYDHQVELLFKGTSHAMRRLFLKDMKEHFQSYVQTPNKKLHFLEVAVGTGSATEHLLKAFPNCKITCVDLSSTYLKKAQENFKDYSHIDFVQAAGENLPFKDETFDGVFSVFMYHELPCDVRVQVIEESLRVLKPGGYLGLTDSIQMDDDKKLNWAILEFPKDFHEPFFKNYINTALETLVPTQNTELIGKKIGFLTKALSYKKR